MWLPKGNVLPNKWIASVKSSSGVELLWDISTTWGLLSLLLIEDSIHGLILSSFPPESEFDLKVCQWWFGNSNCGQNIIVNMYECLPDTFSTNILSHVHSKDR